MMYDYLLTGVTGQVGRYLLRELIAKGHSVAVVMRPNAQRASGFAALAELVELAHVSDIGNLAGVNVSLVDLTDPNCKLPDAERIMNAAGHTVLGSTNPEPYWRENIKIAMKLARRAKETGASFHQLSSVAVAEFREEVLTENMSAVPEDRQLTYSTSKALMELAVTAILPDAQILRIGDVVPPHQHITKDMRRTHWLPMLFSYGKNGFRYAPSHYSVWLSDVSELARAVIELVDYPRRVYHVLGQKYSWWQFQNWALQSGKPDLGVAKWMTDIILYGPEADMVDDTITMNHLSRVGFEWTKLGEAYWQTFAQHSYIQG